jgi:16S rRNA (cytosine1402-N4)-methyltransferase
MDFSKYKKHIPVMLKEVLESLNIKNDGVYVDATFGNGGYSEAILESANCKLIAIDRDPNVLPRANELKEKFGNRFDFRAGCFGDIKNLITEKIDGIIFDIGVSSMQLDQPERGFSFQKDAPLDMRMSQSGQTAADLVNNLEQDDLANIIYKYGEERKSRLIAKKIVEYRETQKEIETTLELASIIHSVIRKIPNKIDPATRTFQALRIAVNDELGELERALEASQDILKEDGVLSVVTFHSLEDRIVKHFMKEKSGKTAGRSRYLPELQEEKEIFFKNPSKAIKASKDEIELNARSRSAKLRYAFRTNYSTECRNN